MWVARGVSEPRLSTRQREVSCVRQNIGEVEDIYDFGLGRIYCTGGVFLLWQCMYRPLYACWWLIASNYVGCPSESVHEEVARVSGEYFEKQGCYTARGSAQGSAYEVK